MIAAMLADGARGDLRMTASATGPRVSGTGRNQRTLASVVLAIWLGPVVFFILFSPSNIDEELGAPVSAELIVGNSWATFLTGFVILAVLVVDEFIVAKLMTSSFRRGRFDPDARRTPTEWEHLVRSLGRNSFRTGLDRVARCDEVSQPPGQADVIVYRDDTPFIGAGDKVDHHVIALPLEPSQDTRGDDLVPISVNDLHRHVADSLTPLRSPSSLGPGGRLEQLRHREQVLMPADRLLVNRFAQTQPPVLPDLHPPPLAHLPLGAARALAESPLEWARYYSELIIFPADLLPGSRCREVHQHHRRHVVPGGGAVPGATGILGGRVQEKGAK